MILRHVVWHSKQLRMLKASFCFCTSEIIWWKYYLLVSRQLLSMEMIYKKKLTFILDKYKKTASRAVSKFISHTQQYKSPLTSSRGLLWFYFYFLLFWQHAYYVEFYRMKCSCCFQCDFVNAFHVSFQQQKSVWMWDSSSFTSI